MKGAPLRIRIEGNELPGTTCGPMKKVRVGLQVKKEVVELHPGNAESVDWETEVAVVKDTRGKTALRGPAIHGPTGEKFLYLVWVGDGANGKDAMFGRIKLQLDGVPKEVFEKVVETGKPLVAKLGLTNEKGGPRFASVRPPLIRWSVGR